MEKFNKFNFWLWLFILLAAGQCNLNAQDPCDPMECCLENEGFEEYEIGSFPTTPPFQTPGYYTYSGSAEVVADGHYDINSIQYSAGTGSAIGYSGGGGVAGPVPAMVAGRDYCIEFCLFVLTDNPPITISVSTGSNVIYSGQFAYSGLWETISIPTYTAAVDHPTIFFNLNGSGEAPILLDNICIDEFSGSGECMADFEVISQSECGELCTDNISCGESLFYTWNVYDSNSVNIYSSTTEDICFAPPSSGVYTFELIVSDGNGCESIYSTEIENAVDPLSVTCELDEDFIALQSDDCTYDYTIPSLVTTGGSFTTTISVLLDGNTYVEGDVVNLPLGTYSVIYFISDECGELDPCIHVITIECEEEVLPEQCGWMVSTCYGTSAIPDVAVLLDTRINSAAPQGQDWNDVTLGTSQIGSIHPTMWNANAIGQVFGIALDDNGGIYFGASNEYNIYDPTPLPLSGPAGTGGIYYTDFNNVNVTTPFVTTVNFANQNTVGSKTIPNTGGSRNGIGNIAFDSHNQQLFVTNLEDGRIYRMDLTGTVLSIFDPLALDNAIPGMASLGEVVYGIGVYRSGGTTKVYYALSNFPTTARQIHSIELDALGEFAANTTGGGLYIDSPQSSMVEIASIPGQQLHVTDIAFSSTGRMLLAERGNPHSSTTLEYYQVGGVWIPGNSFVTGRTGGRNTAGGVDYGARESNGVVNFECDALVWSSVNYAESLVNGCCIYGAQGSDASGNSSNQSVNYANDFFIDYNNTYNTQDKGGIGDLEIFKCGCPPDVSECDLLMVMAEEAPNICVDSPLDIFCIDVWDPVCGCDGQTYSNACYAAREGITTYISGECNGDNTPEVPDLCCYDIDIKNNFGPNIVELEVEMLTTDWIFNTTTLSPPFTFGSCGSLNNKFCIQDASSGSIPSGNSVDAIKACFSPVVSSPTTQPIVEFKWKELIGEIDTLITCRDTLDFTCELPPIDSCLVITYDTISCLGEENPIAYEYCFQVTNNSDDSVGQIVIEDLSPGFSFLPFGTNSKIVVPVPNPLPPGVTSQQICVQVSSSLPITAPQTLCMKMGLIADDGSECCHSPAEICIEVEPCCDPCEDKSVTLSSISGNEDEDCCYSVDITNECAMPYFTKIEAVVNTPGVCFGSHVMGAAHVGNWTVSSTATSICMEPLGGVIDQSSYQDLFQFCLDKIDDPTQANPTITIKWYAQDPATGEQIVVCEDTEDTECEVSDNTCVIISEGDIVCIPDSNKYRYTFKVKNSSNPGFTADRLHLRVKNDFSWEPVPSGPIIQLLTPLAPGDSVVISTCIQGPIFPAPFPNFEFGYRLENVLDGNCCFESKCDTIPVPPCDNCCDAERLDQQLDDYLNTLIVDGCKVSLGPIESDSCLISSINWGENNSGDNYPLDSLACHTYDEEGVYNICLFWEVYPDVGDFPCYSKDTCVLVEIVECPTDCFTVVDIETKTVTCDTVDCYNEPFCLPWLIDDIASVICTGFNDPYYEKAFYNGQPVIIKWQPTIEGLSHIIYNCSGVVLQSCAPTGGGGLACFPDGGIDVSTDLSLQVNIWNCGDAIPMLDASCPTGKSVEYCVKLMNNNPNDATDVQLNPILPPGVFITPNVISTNIPSGGMSTITFTLSGQLSTGVDNKVEATLLGLTPNGDEWMCSDTLCLPTPPCPPVDICCQDIEDFGNLVNQGLQVTDLGNCTYQVCANQFDDCHWFWTATPDWGDGTIVLPTLSQSDSPNNCWTHTYTGTGPYTITLNVEEQNADGEACWDGQMQAIVEPVCEDCCDGYQINDLTTDVQDAIASLSYQACDELCITGNFPDCVEWSIDWDNGGNVLEVLNGQATRCEIYTDGNYTICVSGEVFDENGVVCFEYEECVDISVLCDTPVCEDCPEGEDQGPNLIANGDFESGNIGFTSGHNFVSSPGIMAPGEYGIRDNSTMGNWFWDHSANTSQFLQVDGQAGTVMWEQDVNVIAGETYIFCADFDNLVDPNKLLETASPKISIRINGFTIGGLSNVCIDQLPDVLQTISTSWVSPVNGPVAIDIFMNVTGTYGDIAIDNISFTQCGGCDIGGDPCEFTSLLVSQTDNCCYQVDYDNQYCDNYFKGLQVTTVAPNTVSQVQASPGWYVHQINPYIAEVYPIGTIPMGAGPAFTICGDNNMSNTLDFTVSWLVPIPSGCAAVCSEDFSETCDGDPSGCIIIIDETIDCDQYCFRVTNNTSPAFTINSIVLDQLTPAGAILTPNPISIPALTSGATSSLICVDYTNLLPGDTFCYNVVAHDVDINTGDVPTWCCTDPVQKCATVPDDCSPCDELSIVTTSASVSDTCCWTVDIVNGYHDASFVGVKAKVLTTGAYFANINTTLDWTLNYVAANEYVFDYNAGTGFIPLGTNVTGNFCLTGYTSSLQQVEFSWLQVDAATGDTIEVCPVVIDSDCPALPLPIPCTDISDTDIYCVDSLGNYNLEFNLTNNTNLFGTGYDAYSYSFSNVSTTGSMTINPLSNNLIPVLMPGQTTSTPEVINISGAVPGDTLCFSITLHDQLVGAGYNNCCTVDTIWCYVIPTDAPCNTIVDCCDDYNLDSLTMDVDFALANLVQDGCELCIDGEFLDCVNWYVNWGDGSVSVSTSTGDDTWCYEYENPGTYSACLFAYVLDAAGDTCFMLEQCIDVAPDCPCCDITDDEYDDLFSDLLDFDFETCDSICFYPDGEACDLVEIDFGDGTIVGPQSGDDDICHAYTTDGDYNVCVTMYRPDDDDPTINCIERQECFDVTIDCIPDGDCCDTYTQADLEQDVADALATLDSMDCNFCIDLDFPDCVQWQLNWGDGSVAPGASGANMQCHDYVDDGVFTIYLLAGVSDGVGSQCIEVVDSVLIDIECDTTMTAEPINPCDPSTWDIPNGLTPNGDGFNEVLKFYNTDDCTADIKIYNRWGQMVYNKKGYLIEWFGQSDNGEALPDGTYYILIGTDSKRDGTFDNYITKFVDLRRE